MHLGIQGPRGARGEKWVMEKIGNLHLFLNKIELRDCRGLLSAFEMELRECLELTPEQD